MHRRWVMVRSIAPLIAGQGGRSAITRGRPTGRADEGWTAEAVASAVRWSPHLRRRSLCQRRSV